MANKQNNLQPAAEKFVVDRDSSRVPFNSVKTFSLNFKVMLHGTIRNDDF